MIGVTQYGLTQYQRKIISLMSTGLTNKQIGAHLGVTEQAIKNRLHCIYDKTGMGTRVELALWYEAKIRETSMRKQPVLTTSSAGREVNQSV